MTVRIKREELIQTLETVAPGLAPKEIVEQSSCFVFKDGKVMTFNDEVFCSRSSNLPKDILGAVQAAPLLALLNKLADEEVELEMGEGELLLTAKKRKAGIRMEKDILLPVDAVETPTEWLELPEQFTDAVDMVHQCAGTDESQFVMTCVHLHPNWMEACDNFQLTRYKLKTGISKPCVVRKEALKHIVSLGMNKFAETASWLHFQGPSGLVLACRRYTEDYPDLTPLMVVEGGAQTTLPKGLNEAAEKAKIFSLENTESDQVSVELKPGKLRITGQGNSGWYKEVKDVNYQGEPLVFRISPDLLQELTKRVNDCEITKDRLKVDGGKWVFITCLGKVEGE